MQTWHTSLPNTSGRHRRTVLYNVWSSGLHDVRTWDACHGLAEPELRRLATAGKLPRLRRRILGLPDEGMGE